MINKALDIGKIVSLTSMVILLGGWATRVEIRLNQAKSNQNLADQIEGVRKELSEEFKGVSSDTRSLSRRVGNLEEQLLPVLIKFKTEELAKRPANINAPSVRLKKEATIWATSQLPKPPPEPEPAATPQE